MKTREDEVDVEPLIAEEQPGQQIEEPLLSLDPEESESIGDVGRQMNAQQPVFRRGESFILQFAKTKGPPQITFLMILIAMGLGSTIGVVPAVMTDRFARLNHGYNSTESCASSFSVDDGGSSIDDNAEACYLGSADAQNAVASSNLVSNVLTFLTSSLTGSLSDEYGRRGILIIGLFLSTLPPLMLFMTQLVPMMSPWWYYGFSGLTGIVNWIAVALSAMSDVLPPQFRAPGIGLLLAGFSLGISLSPVLAFFFDQLHLSLISFLVIIGGFVSTIVSFPETLSPQVAEEARRRREEEDDDNEPGIYEQSSWSTLKGIRKVVARPFKEMSILNRSYMFRLVSLLAFFSGMVSSGDQNLLIYYVEERLGFSQKDVSVLLLITGAMGLFVQGVLLRPINYRIGEKMVVALSFFLGAINNFMYGLARDKAFVYAAVIVSSFTGMAFPTISAIKANNVVSDENGCYEETNCCISYHVCNTILHSPSNFLHLIRCEGHLRARENTGCIVLGASFGIRCWSVCPAFRTK